MLVEKLNYRLLAAPGLVTVHDIYIQQLVRVYQLPSLMCTCKHKEGVPVYGKVHTLQQLHW